MMDIELDRDQAKRHADVLIKAREAWFYDYHFSADDFNEYENAIAFFSGIQSKLKEKAGEL